MDESMRCSLSCAVPDLLSCPWQPLHTRTYLPTPSPVSLLTKSWRSCRPEWGEEGVCGQRSLGPGGELGRGWGVLTSFLPSPQADRHPHHSQGRQDSMR